MTELEFATQIAKFIQSYGMIGVVAGFISFLVWQDKQRVARETADRIERKQQTDADRLMWVNHLSGMIKENATSNQELAVGLTKLADGINNFQSRCGKIQDDFQNEVDRLKKG